MREEGLFGSRFRIGTLLGTGGSASVYSAVDVETGDPIAIKVLHPHLTDSPSRRSAFLDEAGRAALVDHGNVISVLDRGVDESSGASIAWIASTLVDGRSLAEAVSVDGPLQIAEALELARGLLDGLGAVHATGLVHRDVTPSNVLIARGDSHGPVSAQSVRIADLGLAAMSGLTVRDDHSSVDAPKVIGSVAFMSPEQLRGDAVDVRSDLYQAAAVIFHALTGRPPYTRMSLDAVVAAHLHAPPPVASALRVGVPSALDRLLVHAMLKDPDERFASAHEMRDAIDVVASRLGMISGLAVSRPETRDRTLRLPAALGSSPIADVSSVESGATAPRHSVDASIEALSAPAELARRDAALGPVAIGAVLLVGLAIAAAVGSGTTGATTSPRPHPTASAPPSAVVAVPTAVASPSRLPVVAVPDVRALPITDATAMLAAVGLRVGVSSPIDAPRAVDTVLSTNPAPGASVTIDAAIDVVVASGRNAVPQVVGVDVDTAAALIRNAGLTVRIDSSATSSSTSSRLDVAGTQPQVGASVPIGSTVVLTVDVSDIGPGDAPTHTPSPTPTATPDPEDPTDRDPEDPAERTVGDSDASAVHPSLPAEISAVHVSAGSYVRRTNPILRESPSMGRRT